MSVALQITRRIRRTLIKTKVNHEVAERKQWVKFGQEQGRKAGPHSSTTTVGENVQLKLSAGSNKVRASPSLAIRLLPKQFRSVGRGEYSS